MGASKSTTQQQHQPGRNKTGVDLEAMAARVDRVHITGLSRTHDDYVHRAVLNCFNATTFQGLLFETAQAKANLTELGIFKHLHVRIDVSHGNKASANGYEVSFEGKELSKIVGSVGTEVGHNEGSATAEVAFPNINGRGERFSIQGSYGSSKTTDINLRVSKPFYHTALGDYKPEVSINLFKNSANFPWYRYTTQDMGIILDYAFLCPTSVQHNLQYEFAVREIGSVGKQAPFYIREHCGPRLASVLRHICAYDQRDSTILPTSGVFFKMTNEMCGMGGDISYIKNITHAEVNVPLFRGMSAQLCGRVGIMQTDKLAAAVPLSSLFTLGGPLTVRGFQTAGIGHHVDGVASGAQTFWASGLHLWAPLPFNRHFGALANHVRMHGFATLGNVNSFTMDGCRCSVGAGLAIKIGERARIELNYCSPVWRGPTDAVLKEGFQFGIGYEFL